jgi:hypothetical protein
MSAPPLRRWHRQLELAELLNRLEAAAHDCVPAAAQYASNWDPEDMERRYTAEQLALLQADLQRPSPWSDLTRSSRVWS